MIAEENKWLVQWALLGRPSSLTVTMFISIPEGVLCTKSHGFYCPTVQLTVWFSQRSAFMLYDWNTLANGLFEFSDYKSLVKEVHRRLAD